MSDRVIQVENLGKKYIIGHQQTNHQSLRDAISYGTRKISSAIFPKKNQVISAPATEFWALQDVYFEVNQGDVVGIIGRNGAGKSTLLKILSRITEPTCGRISIKGRVASLLEVGTGFHGDLTGRENIFLNGAILGMGKQEIKSKFDRIVAFAEVEKFIDTPVKRYSSGMYVRLAFAVAAHLDPEILIVDEVLAVGDAAFQKKCLGKMGDVATKEGKTVLFVSHNMHAIASLCKRVISLRSGKIFNQGSPKQVIEEYLASGSNKSAEAVWSFGKAVGDKYIKLRSVKVTNEEGDVLSELYINQSIRLEMVFWCMRQIAATASFHIYTDQGILLFTTANLQEREWGKREYTPGIYSCSCEIPAYILNEGRYYVHAYISDPSDGRPQAQVKEAVSFQILNNDVERLGNGQGVIRPLLHWRGRPLEALPS